VIGPGSVVGLEPRARVGDAPGDPHRPDPQARRAADVGGQVVPHVQHLPGPDPQLRHHPLEDLRPRLADAHGVRDADDVEELPQPRLLEHPQRRLRVAEVGAQGQAHALPQRAHHVHVVVVDAHLLAQGGHVDVRQDVGQGGLVQLHALEKGAEAQLGGKLEPLGVVAGAELRVDRLQGPGEAVEVDSPHPLAQGGVQGGSRPRDARPRVLDRRDALHVEVDQGVEEVEDDGADHDTSPISRSRSSR